MTSHTASASLLPAGSLLVASAQAANKLAPQACSGYPSDNRQSVSDASTSSSPTELMVHTRARRSNAGNRMSKLIAIEEADDFGRSLYEALEDVPDDDDFSNNETVIDADDTSLESSASEDSSDNEGHGAGDAGLEGEKELEKEERSARRATKRKAQEAFLKQPRLLKRATLRDSQVEEPMSTIALTPTPAQLPAMPIEQLRRKKSERVSWLGTEGSLDSSSRRLSSRSSTLKSRAETHQRLLSKERTRLITVATMKAAEERREALKQKPLTQADRLAEAARMERLNAKSLNRWEEAERKKVAERRAKLEAQRNRCIEGEFIRFWSGSSEVKRINGRLGEVMLNRISLPNQAISSAKTTETSEAQGSLPPSIKPYTGSSDINLPTSFFEGQSNVAMEQESSVNVKESGKKSQPSTLNTEGYSSYPFHDSSASSMRTPTAPMNSTSNSLPKSYSASQSPEIDITKEGRNAPVKSSALLEGIHYWTTQPNNNQHEVRLAASTPVKPTAQTNLLSVDPSNETVALMNQTNETGIPQRRSNDDTVPSILATDFCSPRFRKKEAAQPTQHTQLPASSLIISPFEEQLRQPRSSSQHFPYPLSGVNVQTSSEKRTCNLIIMNNIDPAQIQSSNARDRDREKDLLRSKLFGWPTPPIAIAGAGALGAVAFRSTHRSAYKCYYKCPGGGRWCTVHYIIILT